jgi:hypothetical protein
MKILLPRALLAATAALIASLLSPSLSAQPQPVLHFDGIEAVAYSPYTAGDLNVEGPRPKTIEAWVKVREFNWRGIIQLGDRGTDGGDFSLWVAGDTNRFMGLFWGPDSDLFFEVPDALDNWTHVALTYDGTTLRAYGNGQLIVERAHTIDTQSSPNGLFEIGQWDNQESLYGAIRDVRVWSVARSEAEIQATMNASPFGQVGLELWWPLNEGVGSVVNDGSGKNRGGEIFAAQWEAVQFAYQTDKPADFSMDFGTGAGKQSEQTLLRNRPDLFSLQVDSLRLAPTSWRMIGAAAAAEVGNRSPRQNFRLETDARISQFPGVSESRFGMVALGGPHTPVADPFNPSRDSNFYAMLFYPGAPSWLVEQRFPGITPAGDDTAVIAISRGYYGPVLAAARWEGRKPLPAPLLLNQDFENPANDASWQSGGVKNSWQIGVPTYGPPPTSGSRVAATNLTGEIPTDTESYLRSPVIDLTGVSVAALTFREALQIDGDFAFGATLPYHNAYVRVVDPSGVLIAQLARYSGSSVGWRTQSFSLPPEALNRQIRIEFHVSTDSWVGNGEHGWMIDEVAISIPAQDLSGYALKAEGTYGLSGELELSFTVTDRAGSNHSQTITMVEQNPLGGNLFGVGGALQRTGFGDPTVDFEDLSMTLGDEALGVPTTSGAVFDYNFGSGPGRVGSSNFVLFFESDWTLQAQALRLSTAAQTGASLAATRLIEFAVGKPIEVETSVTLTSYDAAKQGRVGLVLFGNEDPLVFNANNHSTYYTFQYIAGSGTAGKIALRQGMDGAILFEAPFVAPPTVGATYHFVFSGSWAGSVLNFTASMHDGNGGQASLNGQLAGLTSLQNRFGFGASQNGGDVWSFRSFSGNTTGGEERILSFAGPTDVFTTANAAALGIDGSKAKTVEAWVYPRAFNWGGVFQLGTIGSVGHDFSLRVRGGEDEWQAQFWGTADTQFSIPGSRNRWTHIAMVYDGTTAFIYANGVLVTSRAVALNTGTNVPLRIGQWNNERFSGAIRDVRVWNVARSPAQIQASMNASPIGETGLVGWWPLDDGAGTNARDTSGFGRDGVINNPAWVSLLPASLAVGASEVAAHLNFTGTTVVNTDQTAATLGIDGNKPKTVEAWLRRDAYNWQGIVQIGARGSNGGDLSLRTAGNGNDRFQVLVWGTEWFFTVPESLNNWIHVAITYDGTTLRAYGNGELRNSLAISLNTLNDPVRLGVWNNGSYLTGDLRDVRIWTVARTAEEIRDSMYAVPLGQPGLAAWWPLDEGSGSSANDRSGNVRNGTIVAGQWGSDNAVLSLGNGRVVRNGTPATFVWDALFAQTSDITPAPGSVPGIGRTIVTAPGNTVSTYTLVATNKGGAVVGSPSIWVRSVPEDGYETLRYLRFELIDSDAVRDPTEDSVQLAGFEFYRSGLRIQPVSASNPGGSNPGGQVAANLIDSSLETTWRDLNKALGSSQLIFDFGSVVEVDSYRLATAADTPGRDPRRWRLYGRSSTADAWRLIDDMNLNYDLPLARSSFAAMVPLAGPVPQGMTYGDWLLLKFPNPADRADPAVSGRLASPAGDGIANLLKYAFGLDPWVPATTYDFMEVGRQGTKLRLTYLERVDASDLIYQPEKSFNLSAWSADGVVEIGPRVLVSGGEFEWVTVELELNDAAKAFLRVNVQALE